MFNNLIAAYMFFGGTGAGACCVLCCLYMVLHRRAVDVEADEGTRAILRQRFFGFGFLVVSVVSALGSFCLLADMKRPAEILTLIVSPVFSVLSVGAYALATLIVLGAAAAVTLLRPVRVPRAAVTLFLLITLSVGVVVMAYTALLLMAFPAARLFNSPWLVPLFMASSLSCGCAGVILWAQVSRTSDMLAAALRRLRVADGAFIVAEIVVLVVFLLAAGSVAPESADRLLRGDCALGFWLGVVGCGLTVPLALSFLDWRAPSLRVHPILSMLLILIGGFALRWCMLKAA